MSSSFFSIPAGGEMEKKKQNPRNRSYFFCTFFPHFFLFPLIPPHTPPANEKKKRGNFPTYLFWGGKPRKKNLAPEKKRYKFPLMLSSVFFSVSHISRKRKLLYLEVGAKTFYRSKKTGDWNIHS